MEIFSGDEVNPDCITKILMLDFPRVSPTNEAKIKKLKICKIKKNPAHIDLHLIRHKKSFDHRRQKKCATKTKN